MAFNRINDIFSGQLTAPNLPKELDLQQLMSMLNSNFENDRNRNRLTDIGGAMRSQQPQQMGNDVSQFTGMPHSNRRQPMPGIVTPQAQPVRPEVNRATAPQPNRISDQAQLQQPTNKPMNHVLNIMSPYEQATIDFKNRELEQKRSLGTGKLDVTSEGQNQRFEVAKERNSIAEFKANNPGKKFQISKGGNIFAFDPITGEGQDTGISSGTLSDKEKIEITNTGDLAEIEARGNIQKDIQRVRGTQALDQIGARVAGQKDIQGLRGDQAKELQGTKGDQSLAAIAARAAEQRKTNAARPQDNLLPSQSKILEANKARELINSNPELAPFLEKNQDGTYSVMAPGKESWYSIGKTKPTEDQFKQINSILYPNSGTSSPVKAGADTDKGAPPDVTTADGKKWKYVRKPGGGWTAVASTSTTSTPVIKK